MKNSLSFIAYFLFMVLFVAGVGAILVGLVAVCLGAAFASELALHSGVVAVLVGAASLASAMALALIALATGLAK